MRTKGIELFHTVLSVPILKGDALLGVITITTWRLGRSRPYRSREHLTEREVGRLIEAVKGNRWGHRDAAMVPIFDDYFGGAAKPRKGRQCTASPSELSNYRSFSELSKTFASAALSAVSTCSSTAPGGLELASGMAWRTAAMTSFMACQSSIERLPGSDCSIVSLTSGPISRAHVAKKTAGLVWAVNHRLFAVRSPNLSEVFQKALTEYRPATQGPPVRISRLARLPHPAIHMFGWLKSHFFCFLLLIGG